MARLPTIKGDRDNWGDVLNEYLDVSLAEDGTLREAAAAPAIAAGTTEAYAALDIWDGFDRTGATAGSWDATTYAGWIAGIDNLLAGQLSSGAVVKTDLGTASDEATHLYSYAAGNGPVGVLIVSGQHGGETLGMWAAMRWFEQFVTSNETQMRQLRNAFRVTWIPSANPSQYRSSRVNANGVDLNRNYDLFWHQYADGGSEAETYKGTAPESEPETVILAELLRGGTFRHVIDAHNYSAAGDTAMFTLPGHYLLGPRRFGLDSIVSWHSLYGAGMSWSQLNEQDTFPILINYANYALRHVQGKDDSTTMLLEASADLFGSVTTETVTRAAMRAYCGMIQTHMIRVLDNGFRDTAPAFSYDATGYRSASDLATSITEGGALIDTSSTTNVQVTWNTGGFTQVLDETVMPVLVAPSYLYVSVVGDLRAVGPNPSRHTIGVSFDGDTPTSIQRTSVNVSGTAGEYAGFALGAHRYVSSIAPDTLPLIAITAQRNIGSNAELYSLRVLVHVAPDTEGHKMPRLGLMYP